MNKLITTLAGAAMVAALSTGVNAQGTGGELAVWGMGVITSNGVDAGNRCGDITDNAFCGNVLGWGASGSAYVPLNGAMSLSADAFYEFHFETNEDSSERDDHASYGHLGVHLTNESNANMPWGGFVFLASGHNNADNDSAGPVFGLGGEIMVSGITIQAGGMFLIDAGNADDTLENMGFIGASKEFPIWNGAMTVGAMVGQGDFEENSFYAHGGWGQISVFYEAPLGGGNLNWFAGYQLDFVETVEDTTPYERIVTHVVKLGINIPLGGGAGPFKTPNFRAPLTYAGDLN